MSFHDARPRGTSHIDSVERDEWTLDDLCRHLQFRRGTPCLDTDYVRGRMMKTRVTVWPTGVVEIQTTNRHQMASRWVETRKGKTHPRAGACGGWALRDIDVSLRSQLDQLVSVRITLVNASHGHADRVEGMQNPDRVAVGSQHVREALIDLGRLVRPGPT